MAVPKNPSRWDADNRLTRSTRVGPGGTCYGPGQSKSPLPPGLAPDSARAGSAAASWDGSGQENQSSLLQGLALRGPSEVTTAFTKRGRGMRTGTVRGPREKGSRVMA